MVVAIAAGNGGLSDDKRAVQLAVLAGFPALGDAHLVAVRREATDRRSGWQLTTAPGSACSRQVSD